MARTRSSRKTRRTRKQRGGDYLNDYEKEEAAKAAAEKKRRNNAAAVRAAHRAAQKPEAIEAAKRAEAAAFANVGKQALAALNRVGLKGTKLPESEHLAAARELHERQRLQHFPRH